MPLEPRRPACLPAEVRCARCLCNAGKGLNGLALPFPVFLLDEGTAENARQRAAYNAQQARRPASALLAPALAAGVRLAGISAAH